MQKFVSSYLFVVFENRHNQFLDKYDILIVITSKIMCKRIVKTILGVEICLCFAHFRFGVCNFKAD